MRLVAICLALATTSGCSKPTWQEAVEAQLVDGDSAKFRGVQDTGKGVCGEVNAKNRMGGYAGFERFAYENSTGIVGIGPPRGLSEEERRGCANFDIECQMAARKAKAEREKHDVDFVSITIFCPL